MFLLRRSRDVDVVVGRVIFILYMVLMGGFFSFDVV